MYNKAIDIVLKHEGGYVNNPRDAGGETNFGISKRAYPYLDIARLSKDVAAEMYRRDYWEKCQCDRIPRGLDLCVVDFAVNAGVSRASKVLQVVVGAEPDGIIGSKTLRLVADDTDVLSMITHYHRLRQAYYESLDSFHDFGRGWTRRNNEILKESLTWI
tara:strand:+ start:302 stop:781 length:480 start_codon:yes stop_codon:yes gene_type:complete